MQEKQASKLQPVSQEKNCNAEVSFSFYKTMTRRRRENEEFAMFRATIIPHTGPLLFSILLCYILPFPSGK